MAATGVESSQSPEALTVREKILAMWEQLLGFEGINPEANFFELGGDSMTAIRLLRRLREEVHPGVNLDDFETHDTRTLIEGVAVTVEPGIYLPEFGVRSEVNVLMTAGGPRVTTRLQREITLLR